MSAHRCRCSHCRRKARGAWFVIGLLARLAREHGEPDVTLDTPPPSMLVGDDLTN